MKFIPAEDVCYYNALLGKHKLEHPLPEMSIKAGFAIIDTLFASHLCDHPEGIWAWKFQSEIGDRP